ncbi:hypothetical protein [Paracoccus marcusii]|uniref:hypothetical protein n=1 Tax=Paracoccus marcusii TaxID=59779 RepID=UPI002491A6C6|nr:hypothetical protein [Paracoccus marcusii]
MLLIAQALSSYQHNAAFRSVKDKVRAIVDDINGDQPKACPLPRLRRPQDLGAQKKL